MYSFSRRQFLGVAAGLGIVVHVRGQDSLIAAAGPATCRTGLVFDSRYLDHFVKRFHYETPQRLKAIEQALKEKGIWKKLQPVVPVKNPRKYIERTHSEKHILEIGKDTKTSKIAMLAAAGVCGAVEAVATGKVRNAFCAVRPPGHHASNNGKQEGFCYFNNVAVAAQYAQEVHGLKKVLIVDWDYHHGNGTENLFYSDPSVLFFSTHNKNAYPMSGSPSRKGEGAGSGLSINVHLPCRSDAFDILKAIKEQLIPAANDFKPQLVIISAGFDIMQNDPLGCFDVSPEGMKLMTAEVMKIADKHCGGKLVSALEGGYNLKQLADGVCAHIETLCSSTD